MGVLIGGGGGSVRLVDGRWRWVGQDVRAVRTAAISVDVRKSLLSRDLEMERCDC
jgi:hypothetical protein